MQITYHLFVPFAPAAVATKWHPTTSVGPFSVLNRGRFPTMAAAVAWGKANLNGCPYTIHEVDEAAEFEE